LLATPPLNLRATGEDRRDGLYQDDLQRKVTSNALQKVLSLPPRGYRRVFWPCGILQTCLCCGSATIALICSWCIASLPAPA